MLRYIPLFPTCHLLPAVHTFSTTRACRRWCQWQHFPAIFLILHSGIITVDDYMVVAYRWWYVDSAAHMITFLLSAVCWGIRNVRLTNDVYVSVIFLAATLSSTKRPQTGDMWWSHYSDRRLYAPAACWHVTIIWNKPATWLLCY